MEAAGIYLGVVALTGLVALWWKRGDGRARETSDRFTVEQIARAGAPGGVPLLLEFTAPHCAPCAATKQILDDVAGLWPEVQVHTADVGDVLDLARAHHVLRAPTTFVLDGSGAVHGRISGVPDPGDVGRLVEEAVSGFGTGRRGPRVRADISVEPPGGPRPRWASRRRARLAR